MHCLSKLVCPFCQGECQAVPVRCGYARGDEGFPEEDEETSLLVCEEFDTGIEVFDSVVLVRCVNGHLFYLSLEDESDRS